MKKKKFWKRCLMFDLICICLVSGIIFSGVGKGKKIKQELISVIQMQESKKETSAQSQGDTSDTEDETAKELSENESKEKKKIAITFDDGPNEKYTPEMLNALKERNVKATFFLLGEEVEKYPEIVKQIYEEGHLIGNHSYKHEQLSKLSMEQACNQVNRTNELIHNITGIYPAYLRPPFGDWHEELDCEMNMVEVLWDVDTLDWSSQNHAKIVNKVLKNIQENDIILMHDGYETSVTAAVEIIDTLQKQGYEFVTVDEILFE